MKFKTANSIHPLSAFILSTVLTFAVGTFASPHPFYVVDKTGIKVYNLESLSSKNKKVLSEYKQINEAQHDQYNKKISEKKKVIQGFMKDLGASDVVSVVDLSSNKVKKSKCRIVSVHYKGVCPLPVGGPELTFRLEEKCSFSTGIAFPESIEIINLDKQTKKLIQTDINNELLKRQSTVPDQFQYTLGSTDQIFGTRDKKNNINLWGPFNLPGEDEYFIYSQTGSKLNKVGNINFPSCGT